MATVYLTGAGPGDIDLLTVKALKVIQKADALVYDKLVNSDILKIVKKTCKLIFVGKERKNHIIPQEEINNILYELSLKYKNIVRLKGGDPFVFGRGGEEAIYLKDKGVNFEIIPGISSAISVPAYAGIPVTQRGITTSFRVVTGHETPNKKISQMEWESFLNNETIVFLMGYYNIELISKKLISLGKDKNHPCAVISKGTTKEQKVIVSSLENIAEESKEMETPAIIVIGEVVSLKDKISWFNA